MHELGVVMHVIERVEQIARENNAKHIQSVTIELGEVSAVVPGLLSDCWKWAVQKQDMMHGCELKIEGVQAITHCEDCGHDYPTTVFEKQCPYCDGTNTYLIQGQEFTIKDIAVCDSAPDDTDAGPQEVSSEVAEMINAQKKDKKLSS